MSITHFIEIKRYDLASSLLITKIQSLNDNLSLRKDWSVLNHCLYYWLPLSVDEEQRKSCFEELEKLSLFQENTTGVCSMFANTELNQMNYVGANFYFNKALQNTPPDPALYDTANNVRNSLVVRWNFRMLNDQIRNSSYKSAINKATDKFSRLNKRCPNILDVGSGTGILSLYCVHAGAAKVIAVEQDTTMFKIAEQVCRNENVIELHNCMSNELHIDPDIIDIVVTETLDSIGIGEGIIPICHELAGRSNFQNTQFIPSDVTVCGFIVGSELLHQSSFCGEYRTNAGVSDNEKYCCEFINEFPDLQVLSDPSTLLKCKVGHPFNERNIKIVSFLSTSVGWCDGVCSYFKAYLFEDIAITSAPSCIKSDMNRVNAWEQGFHPLPRKWVKVGDILKVKVSFSDVAIRISWVGDDEMCGDENILECKQIKLLNSFMAKTQCTEVLNLIPKIFDVTGLLTTDPMKYDAISNVKFSGYVIHSNKLQQWTSVNNPGAVCLRSDQSNDIMTLMNQYRTLIHQNIPWTTLEHTKLSDYLELINISTKNQPITAQYTGHVTCSQPITKNHGKIISEIRGLTSLTPLSPTALVFWIEVSFKSGATFNSATETLWRPAAIIFPNTDSVCEKYTLHTSYQDGMLSAAIEILS